MSVIAGHRYEVYKIGTSQDNYSIEAVGREELYSGKHSYRKAVASHFPTPVPSQSFVDDYFKLSIGGEDVNEKGQKYVMRRIF